MYRWYIHNSVSLSGRINFTIEVKYNVDINQIWRMLRGIFHINIININNTFVFIIF